jgi:hypothetical protein
MKDAKEQKPFAGFWGGSAFHNLKRTGKAAVTAFCIAAREFLTLFNNHGRRLHTEAGVNLSVQACWALEERGLQISPSSWIL